MISSRSQCSLTADLISAQSHFLELLFKHNCIRTQKKQKVFYWFSVPHDRLFLDALDRDLKREKLGQDSTTFVEAEPALSFRWDPSKSLFDQFAAAHSDPAGGSGRTIATGSRSPPSRQTDVIVQRSRHTTNRSTSHGSQSIGCGPSSPLLSTSKSGAPPEGSHFLFPPDRRPSKPHTPADATLSATPSADQQEGLGMFALFEGAPTYKQRTRPLLNRRGCSTAMDSRLAIIYGHDDTSWALPKGEPRLLIP